MANAIVQAYLDDPAVSSDKKQKVWAAVKAGQSQDDIAELIKMKYGASKGKTYNAIQTDIKDQARQEAFKNVDISIKPEGIDQKVWDYLDENGKRSMAVNFATLQTNNPEKAKQVSDSMVESGKSIADIGYTGQEGSNPFLPTFGKNLIGSASAAVGGIAEGASKTLGTMADVGGWLAEKSSLGLVKRPKEGAGQAFREGGEIASNAMNSIGNAVGADPAAISGGEWVGKTAEQIGEFLLPAAKISKASTAANEFITNSPYLAKMPSWIQKSLGVLAKGGTEAAAYGGISALQEGEINNNVILNTAIAGGLPILGNMLKGGWGWLADRISGKVGTTVKEITENQLLKQGVKESYVNMLGGADDVTKQVASDYFEQGLNKVKNYQADDIYKYATQESGLNQFWDDINNLKDSFGKNVKSTKQGLSKTTIPKINLQESVGKFDDIFSKYNIKVAQDGTLKFNNSELANVKEAQNQLQKAYDLFTKGKRSVNARNLEAITGQIDLDTGLLKSSGLKTGDPGVDALTSLKTIINDAVGKSNNVFKKANTQYAEFIEKYNQIKKAGDVILGNGKKVFNPVQILKRSLTTGDKKYTDAIKAMDDLAKKFGIKAPKDLNVRAQLADITEKITQSAPSRSLEGITQTAEQLAGYIPGSVGTLVKTKQFLGKIFTGKMPKTIEENVNKIINILDNSIQANKQVVLPPKEASFINQILKAVTMEAGTELPISNQNNQ